MENPKITSNLLANKTTSAENSSKNAGKFSKRQAVTRSASVTLGELLKMCPLNNVTNADVPAGCISGLYNRYCRTPSDTGLLIQCHKAYNDVFAASIFKPLGDVCPAWKAGPYTSTCLRAVSTFSYSLKVGINEATGETIYLKLTSAHASQLVANVFASQIYAPCEAPLTCNWRV
jgi:hypothetical protein